MMSKKYFILFKTFSSDLQIDSSTGVITTVADIETACNCSSVYLNLTILATDTGNLVGSVPVSIYVGETTTIITTIATDRL